MVLETTKERYKNKTGVSEFKRFHWWEAMRHQPKWRAKPTGTSTTDQWVSSSDPVIEEEVTHPIGRDRVKVAAQKGKGNEGSNSQNESSFIVGDIMSTLKRLSTSFANAQLWNKLKNRSTTNMDDEELKIHHETLQLILRDLKFAQVNEAAIEDEDDK
jgi:hypothetical protein